MSVSWEEFTKETPLYTHAHNLSSVAKSFSPFSLSLHALPPLSPLSLSLPSLFVSLTQLLSMSVSLTLSFSLKSRTIGRLCE